ncbi:MBL fold metallo-hydrolase [Anaerolineae bacterium CFX9]|jgi:L-ascorbate metabolism protein UlaG (beta-lactamase superfamily)|nr:MBL fold metallo-hydrolase [Anaerolineae bacterium CFX9]
MALEITWYGHSCFRITERGRITAVTDPFSESLGIPVPKLKADIVTISHDVPGHNALDTVKSDPYVLRGSGEYEIGGVFVTGIAMHTVSDSVVRSNVAYLFDYDNLTVLHLGDLAHVPDQSMVEEMGQVNVLLVPVGGGNGLSAAQAAEVVALIEPHYIIPMHYELPGLAVPLDPVDRFLKAMGVSKSAEQDVLKLSASDLPEQPQVIVLKPQS